MRNPLSRFSWATLYREYDAKCRGYDMTSHCLDHFAPSQPTSDRNLYYRLVERYALAERTTDRDAIATYQALLYWKLYSSAGRKGTNILKWLAPEAGKRNSIAAALFRALSELPPTVDRNADLIIRMIRELPEIPGMGAANDCRLPVRTTFLHFLYPSVVPVFDKMVLSAVGIEEKDANRSYGILRKYLPFAWELADLYAAPSALCERETPLRRVDMALWVNRGSP